MVSEEQQSEMELASEKIPVPPVENPVEEPGEVEEPKPEVPRKKPRKRHRELHASILKQMEFYFGDSNLSKDRFLAKLISENPWVDLNIFIKFNKIKSLTTDVSRIAKALKESTMLSVSEDRTKVCRITPIQEKQNSDECTVYVQRLPPEADHDWISKMFSQYGSIDYISIPKYKNKAIKGFAFVEYKTPEDAQKCIKAFRSKGCVLPSQTSPNTLLSITTHEDCDEEIAKEPILKKEIEEEKMGTENIEESDSKIKSDKSEVSQNGKKKKKRTSVDETAAVNDEAEHSKKAKKKRHGSGTESDRSDSQSNAPKLEKKHKKGKKRKAKNTESLNASDGNEEVNDSSASECDKKKMKRDSSETESKSLLDQEAETQSEERISKKRRMTDTNQEKDSSAETAIKERKCPKDVKAEEAKEESGTDAKEESQISEGKREKGKKKKRKRKRSGRREEIEAPETGLEIMAKKEWKRLRNKYLEMQRAKMKQLKQHLKKAKWNQWQNAEKIKVEKKEDMNDKDAVKEEKSPRFTYTPGVIVRIEMESPCSDPKNFKMELKGSSSNSTVQYVDVSEGSNIAFVRCDSAESAKFLAQKANEERTMSILEGEQEKAYWDKIAKDRQEKIENNVRIKHRGRDKLLKKAEKELGKHIKFDEV